MYFAKDGAVSLMSYAGIGMSRWANSEIKPLACAALAEIVNSPDDFRSKQPYYVVQHVDWIMWYVWRHLHVSLCSKSVFSRYLLVKSDFLYMHEIGNPTVTEDEEHRATEYVTLDPKQELTMNQKQIKIPEQSHKLQMLIEARKAEMPQQDLYDEEDDGILNGKLYSTSQPNAQFNSHSQGHHQGRKRREAADDWQHNEEWCNENTYVLLPPPVESTSRAASVLQKELRGMLREQESAVKDNGLKELGWYLPPQLMGDNLFRWMLECVPISRRFVIVLKYSTYRLHSFDPALPIAQDMAKKYVYIDQIYSDKHLSFLFFFEVTSRLSYSRSGFLRASQISHRSSV